MRRPHLVGVGALEDGRVRGHDLAAGRGGEDALERLAQGQLLDVDVQARDQQALEGGGLEGAGAAASSLQGRGKGRKKQMKESKSIASAIRC